LANETILIIDDTEENREFVVKYVLEPEGYNTLTAKDGEEGLKMALRYKPDLILLDMNMPRMDGRAVLEYLYEHRIEIPVIFMTAHGSEDIAVEVHRMGAQDYIRKPFYPEEMLKIVENTLTRINLTREKEALTRRLIQANQELQNRVQELNVLYSIGKSVTAMINMNQLLPRIVEASAQITNADEAYLLLLEDEKLMCRSARRHNAGRAKPMNEEIRDVIAAHIIKTRQSAVIDPEKFRLKLNPMPTSAAYTPLIIKDKVIGALGVRNVVIGKPIFTNHDAALLSALGDYAAIAIENARNYEALQNTQDEERERMRDTFERFVPPPIVSQALSKPESLQLGGKRQEITVLFADIRGYTTWSEEENPEKVIEGLNHYLSIAAEVILAWEGTLDKYTGDGLMAVFNAPQAQADHVHRAADAALALIKAANEVQSQHGHRLTYSIGVHVGEAVVGYIGTERAMNYTAVGDVVNLAKRLQEYAAPGQILVEESVIKRLGALAQARPLGEVRVKGRKRTATAYELSGLSYEDK
jgi:class 3 adenylate cyclase/DNA-binding response OmpR family regulator